MTTFEYFKARYDANRDYMVECIRKEIPVDSFHFVEVASRFCFGGTAEVDPNFNIIGVTDTQEMKDSKMLWAKDGYRNGRPARFVGLTKKGLRAFYKAMF